MPKSANLNRHFEISQWKNPNPMKYEWGMRRESKASWDKALNWANERMGMACKDEVWGIKRERKRKDQRQRGERALKGWWVWIGGSEYHGLGGGVGGFGSVEIGEFLGGMGSFGFGCWVWVLLGLNWWLHGCWDWREWQRGRNREMRERGVIENNNNNNNNKC